MSRVRKAVIPAGGFGTRMLPATKAVPKEMLTLIDKPVIQYCVEEAVDSGCDQILIITSRGKVSIEDHFDSSPELEQILFARQKATLLDSVKRLNGLARISFTRQPEALGLGHAVLMSKEFVGTEPFALLLPDDVFQSTTPCIKQLASAFSHVENSIIGNVVVEGQDIERYGCLALGKQHSPGLFELTDLVEKPLLCDAPSSYGIVGRYVLSHHIFGHLESISPGVGGELQLTDGLRSLMHSEPVYTLSVEGIRHDVGDKLGFVKAILDYALSRSDLSEQLHIWLKARLS